METKENHVRLAGRRIRPHRNRLGELGKAVAEQRDLYDAARMELGQYATEVHEEMKSVGVPSVVAMERVLQAIDVSWIDDWTPLRHWAMAGELRHGAPREWLDQADRGEIP